RSEWRIDNGQWKKPWKERLLLCDSLPLRDFASKIRSVRATSEYETSKNPEYFPNDFKNVQNSRVSPEVDNLTT
ncbi:MAG TPA: hypothetical protein VLA12_09885, partial [Planctomycetaceae bacterium]|nr:hypothetical protein [Planctomycetaceae bacterium]